MGDFMGKTPIGHLEDKLATKKMAKISEEVKQGKRRVFSEPQIKQRYGFL